jgi:hypothetical protein
MSRCVATNPAGARCLYQADHGNIGHLFAGDPLVHSFMLGKLQTAVAQFLAGETDREFLARALAETEEVW